MQMGRIGHGRQEGRTASEQAPLCHIPGFHQRAGRIFHGGLLGMQIIGKRDYRKKQDKSNGQGQKTVAAIVLTAPGGAFHLSLPEEEGSHGHQHPDYVQQDFHGSNNLSILPGTGFRVPTITGNARLYYHLF